MTFGIDVLDAALPRGVPRNSFIILCGDGGTGKSVFLVNIAYTFLKRGEQVIYVALDDGPHSIAALFKTFRIDIDKYISERLFGIIDAFSFRLGPLKKPHPSVIREVNPKNLDQLVHTINDVIDEWKLVNKGLLIIDSLNEIFFQTEMASAFEFVKTIRAIAAKARNILTISSLHTPTQTYQEIAKTLEYMVDGFIELRYEPRLMEIGIPLKQYIIRKMRGVPHHASWVPYVIAEDGIKMADIKKVKELMESKVESEKSK